MKSLLKSVFAAGTLCLGGLVALTPMQSASAFSPGMTPLNQMLGDVAEQLPIEYVRRGDGGGSYRGGGGGGRGGGSAYRGGGGGGSAYRGGSRGGSAYRGGSRGGSAYRSGSRGGSAYRSGSRGGSAYRGGRNRGNANRYHGNNRYAYNRHRDGHRYRHARPGYGYCRYGWCYSSAWWLAGLGTAAIIGTGAAYAGGYCERMSYLCAENWGSGGPDYWGCMRYEGCD